ncbi:DUF4430 domain-containing protein [Candidatus Solincola sp.]|nr:DUF4430 domain-containing protein [Actinomycetota bacterium]
MSRAGGEVKGRPGWFEALALALAAMVAFFLVRGCSFMPWNRSGREVEVRVTVTRDFGTVALKDENIRLEEGGSAMDALREVAEVETAYSGGFIQGIDGLRSRYDSLLGGGEKVDWFFYVNGHMADMGADSYEVRDGDWLVFDYHTWDYSTFTPFLAGCFLQAFRNGYGGRVPESIVILNPPGDEEQAEEVAAILEEQGLTCENRLLGEHWVPREDEYAVVVGTWKELENNPYLREAQSNASRLGLYAYFEGGELKLAGPGGEVAEVLSGSAGLLEGTGPRLGDGRSALLVSGLDEEGLQAAVEALRVLAAEGGRPVTALAALPGREPLAVPGEVR